MDYSWHRWYRDFHEQYQLAMDMKLLTSHDSNRNDRNAVVAYEDALKAAILAAGCTLHYLDYSEAWETLQTAGQFEDVLVYSLFLILRLI